jgi:hypothetical protein
MRKAVGFAYWAMGSGCNAKREGWPENERLERKGGWRKRDDDNVSLRSEVSQVHCKKSLPHQKLME